MNNIQIEVKNNNIEIKIDNQSLIDLVTQFEKPFAKNLAGQYEWVSLNEYIHQELSNSGENEDDKVTLLECNCCGESGCWPLQVQVMITDKYVKWFNFEQPHRSEESSEHWKYDEFGPFVFERSEYEKEISKITTNVNL